MILRLVLYATLGTTCSVLGYTWDSWQFWSFLGLFWAAQKLAEDDGYKIGVAQGVQIYMNMTEQQQQELRTKLKELDQ